MKFQSPFVLPVEEYTRDLNLVKHYVTQNAYYLHKRTGKPIEVCESYVEKQIRKGGKFELKDPVLTHTYRGDNGDRAKVQSGYLQYLTTAIKERDVIAPTLTRYKNPLIKESIQVGSIDNKKKLRAIDKEKMFQADRDGNEERRVYYYNSQTGRKLSNNAVSGGYCSTSTIIYNPSGHTSLTSTCRVTAGYGSMNNEKVLAGNRHYYDDEIVIGNILSICSTIDKEKIANTCSLYQLKYPSHEEVMDAILRCTRLYWNQADKEERIWELVKTLGPEERAAFMYTGDLYNTRILNDNFMKEFITDLIRPATEPHPDPDSVFKSVEGDYITVACQIHSGFMNGKELKKLKGTREYGIVAATLYNFLSVLHRHKAFFSTFFLTRNVPASIAFAPSSVRFSVLMGDTDSTMFTVQEWVKWFTGSYAFTEISNAVCETMIFLASQSITHCLALLSANLGVRKERLFENAMKNEYRFDSFTPTPKAKHYYALIGRQEANSYVKRKVEVKGVHLKSSAAPKAIMKAAEEKMVELSNKALKGEKISIVDEYQFIANIEHSIVNAIKSGQSSYFRLQRIKDSKAYKQEPTKSNYLHYTMWQEVFQDKYGTVDPPPYPALKINMDIESKTDWLNFVASIKDEALKQRLLDFCVKYGREIIKTFYIPKGFIIDNGVPEELMNGIDIRRIVLDNTKVFYLILESLGQNFIDDKINKLAMDTFELKETFIIE
ncbi:MAG: hypothetical protein M0R77_00855 [Gammaproteobacteria bacterium]|nr:hypothetical protein [Acholeplasmataceae bacterium]MCK9529104.1 hypothetical protein [Gammaproteobacteria bacterium]